MNDIRPQTPSTPGSEPIQDKVRPPTSNAPASSAPPIITPAVRATSRPRGANASAIVLGLVAMVLAGLIIATETMNWHIDWSGLGPGGIVVVGVVLVVIGAIGLVRRHDDV